MAGRISESDTRRGIWPPRHIRKGLRRAYLVVSVPWVIILGVFAYTSHSSISRWQSAVRSWSDKEQQALLDPAAAQVSRSFEVATGETYESMFRSAIAERTRASENLKISLMALPIVPLGLPLIYWIALWVSAGFARETA